MACGFMIKDESQRPVVFVVFDELAAAAVNDCAYAQTNRLVVQTTDIIGKRAPDISEPQQRNVDLSHNSILRPAQNRRRLSPSKRLCGDLWQQSFNVTHDAGDFFLIAEGHHEKPIAVVKADQPVAEQPDA